MKVEEFEDRVPKSTVTGALQGSTPAPRRVGTGIVFLVLILAVAGVIGWYVRKGINSRVAAETKLETESHENAILTVSIVKPKLGQQNQELILPGNTQPIIEAPIYARTNGYLKSWTADIGTRVKAGQVLAEIETPEVDQQLRQARADLETAKANLALAEVTAQRMINLQQQGAVAKQDTDNVVGDRNAKRSIVESQTANVKRLETLQTFEKVAAPFDGVITARNTDVGYLIDAASSGKELFHLAAINKLRIFINVPEEHEQAAKIGAPATLTLNEFPGRVFKGTIVRNANAIDPVSRTLLVEVDVDNPTGELLPGAYVSVHIRLEGSSVPSVIVPVNTLLFRSEGLRAAVYRDGKAVLVPIQVGRDFGDSLEVVSGLSPDDQLILNPPDSLVSGTPVRVAAAK
ncbi:MAG TPA: efflux RND transporter periplasmic adaptor subunit [Bryobacteraceae bacterium]|nr:efflux RND transporter periplasmic adaptor subunit [Bryobacteraceae bacterium]